MILNCNLFRFILGSILVFFFTILVVNASTSADRIVKKLQQTTSAQSFEMLISELTIALDNTDPNFQVQIMEKVVKIARNKSFAEKVMPEVYKLLGITYANGNLDKAIEYFLASSSLFKEQQKTLEEALAYFQIAFLHHKAKNYLEAQEYYQKTLDLGGDSLESRTLINCYNGLALIARENENFEAATQEFKKAFSIALQTKDTAWIGILYGNLGSVFKRKHQYDSALHYYQLNLTIIKNTIEYENLVEAYIHLGAIFIALNKLDKSKLYLDSGMTVFEGKNMKVNDFFNPFPSFYENYALLYAKLGEFQKAFDYHKLFHGTYVELEEAIKSRSLIELNALHTFREKQMEVELLEKINASKNKVIDQQRDITIAFVIIILLSLMLALIMFLNFKNSRKSNHKLNQLNAQILEHQAEIKLQNNNLLKTNEELNHLNKTKDKLFSIISHDLRSPIGTLTSLLELLATGQIKQEEFKEFSEVLSIRLTTVNSALDNLLAWAISQIKGIKVNPTSFIVHDIVEEVFEQLKEGISKKNIQFNNDVSKEVEVFADQNQIMIVIRNLISNAIKFTPNYGTIKVATANRDTKVLISVEDTGVGMDEEEMKNLFNSDHKTSTLGTNNEKGTGIGLVISKELVKENGGKLSIKSKKGEGSTFIFTLPAFDENSTEKDSALSVNAESYYRKNQQQ